MTGALACVGIHRPARLGTAIVRAMLPDWSDDVVHWARRNEDVWELWLFGDSGNTADAVSMGMVLAPVDGNHSSTLGNFSLLDAKWRNELRTITGRQVRLEPMVPGYPGDRTIRSIGTCLWKRSP